jgi:methionine-rich copper-binding protein CopC
MKHMVLAALAVVAGLAALAYGLSSSPVFAQLDVTEESPADGEVLPEPPTALDVCFSEPVIYEYEPGEDRPWSFSLKMPDGKDLGMRIIWQTDGLCVTVEPGIPDDAPSGTWTFDWLVVSQEGGEELSKATNFRVGSVPDTTPTPQDGADEDGDGDTVIFVIVGVAIGLVVLAGAAALVLRRRSNPA